MPVETLPNYIGGRWVPAQATEIQEVRNPATDEVLGLVPLCGEEDVGVVVEAAASVFPSWRATPPQERAPFFFHVCRLLKEHREELARLITTELEKVLEEARGEVQRGLENVETACAIPPPLHGL